MRTQGFGALAPQPVEPSGQLGKEQTLAYAEDLLSQYGVGFGRSYSTPHAGTRSVSVELLEYVQEQYPWPFGRDPNSSVLRRDIERDRLIGNVSVTYVTLVP